MNHFAETDLTGRGELRADVVVVGSGPGGAVTACTLAEGGRDVLLIEEGPRLSLDDTEPFSRDELERKYRNGGFSVALGGPAMAFAEGRCVGGGSEVNSGLYHRTPPEILEQWRRTFGLRGASEEELAPHFETCERDVNVSLLPNPAPPASLRLHDGAEALGWQSLEVPRWSRYADDGTERRQSMTETYLPRALEAGCRLASNARAQRVQSSSGKFVVSGVQTSRGGLEHGFEIRAERVVLASGAIQTPLLLRRSGIRNHVGRTLHFHPTVKVIARFPDRVNDATMGVPVHQVKEFSPRIGLGCAISQPPHLALAMLDHPDSMPGVLDEWQHHASYYAMTRGGVGAVRTLPLFEDPLVTFRLSNQDFVDLAEGLRHLCQCLWAAGADTLYPSVRGLGPFRDEADLAKLPSALPRGATSLMTIHAFSTCPMGEDRTRTATDSFGRVHDVPGLSVADASLLCSPPSVNPQGSVMAFARRNAMAILGEIE